MMIDDIGRLPRKVRGVILMFECRKVGSPVKGNVIEWGSPGRGER